MLTEYNKKRDFKNTKEPEGSMPKKVDDGLAFVVQMHDASHLHYDFRLELDGVLKSWAVPKGPSMNPTDKRLAVHVEDHPYDYKDFEGTIPKGNYGAGTVKIWDNGVYFPIDENHKKISKTQALKNIDKGELKIVLLGKKLKGEFVLVQLKKDEKNWLLIKHKDEFAQNDTIEKEEDNAETTLSKVKKKPINNYLEGDDLIKPMLAHSVKEAFDDDGFIYEIKWDGYRAIAQITDGEIQLYSRNAISFNDRFNPIVTALKQLKHNVVLDGEVIALIKGKPSFQALQHVDEKEAPLRYMVFDLISLDNQMLKELTLLQRKSLLAQLFKDIDDPHLGISEFIKGKGIEFFNNITKQGYEGVMAKKADSLYTEDARTQDWLKIKSHKDREAIIVGFTQPKGARSNFGSLLLADNDNNRLKFIGHTGTGFDEKTLTRLYKLMKPLETDKSPFPKKITMNGPVTWIKPKLICTVYYAEQTADGLLRHPVFKGLQEDKNLNEITAEANEENTNEERMPNNNTLQINKTEIAVTNLNKVYFPERNITKGDLIAYYNSMAPFILPYLKDRPLSLKRNPNGIHGEAFYHKDAGDKTPSYIKTFEIFSESSNHDINYIICNNEQTLIYLINLGCIELNPWNSIYTKPDNPTYLLIDLDPSDNNDFEQVIETAQAVKEVLDKAKLDAYCKTSGASGLHIYIPLNGKYDYDTVKNFAEIIAGLTHTLVPNFTSLERNLKKRGNNIYIDFLQNRRGQTLASAYCIRPVEAATVSTPIDWKELKKGLHPSQFDIFNIHKRLDKTGDIFKNILTGKNDISKALKLLGGK